MKTFMWICSALLVAVAAIGAGAFYAARAVLAPLPGEWSVPLRFGPFELQAGVPSLIRLATSPWGGPLLDGRAVPTRAGRLQLQWQASTRTLLLRCAPCILQPPGLGQDGLQIADAQVTARRQGELLSGELIAGRLRGTWRGEVAQSRLRLQLSIPATPLADGYALFAQHIPELAQARIAGNFALQAQLSLPSGSLTVAPSIEGFEVTGPGHRGPGRRAHQLQPRAARQPAAARQLAGARRDRGRGPAVLGSPGLRPRPNSPRRPHATSGPSASSAAPAP